MEKEIRDFIGFSKQYKLETEPYIIMESYAEEFTLIKCTKEGAIMFASEILQSIDTENKGEKEFHSFQRVIEDESTGGVLIGLKLVDKKPTTTSLNTDIKPIDKAKGIAATIFGSLFFFFIIISVIVGGFTLIDYLIGLF